MNGTPPAKVAGVLLGPDLARGGLELDGFGERAGEVPRPLIPVGRRLRERPPDDGIDATRAARAGAGADGRRRRQRTPGEHRLRVGVR